MGFMGTRFGVLVGELWLVVGEDTGDESLFSEDFVGGGYGSLSRSRGYIIVTSFFICLRFIDLETGWCLVYVFSSFVFSVG